MGRSNLTKLRSSLVKLKMTVMELEYRKIGVPLALDKLDNQLSTVGIALAEFGSKTRMDDFNIFMENLAIVKMEVSNKEISIDSAREQLVKLGKLKLFSYI